MLFSDEQLALVDMLDRFEEQFRLEMDQQVFIQERNAGQVRFLRTDHAAQSLHRNSSEQQQERTAEYWKERAFIYTVGKVEYFCNRLQQPRSVNEQLSENLFHTFEDVRLDDVDEWAEMIVHYCKKHRQSESLHIICLSFNNVNNVCCLDCVDIIHSFRFSRF